MQHALNPNNASRQDFSHYRYYLWRKHDQNKVLEGFYPEILSTNGQRVRRMMSHHKQIIYQDFEDTQSANTIVQRIESSVTPGITLVGYTMFKKYRSIAILQTGQNASDPGWLAFPYQSNTIDASGDPTVSIRTVMNYPKLRLVSGAGIFWQAGKLVIHAALEQRGADFLAEHPNFNLFDYLESWTIHTIAYKNGEQRNMEVALSPEPSEPLNRASNTRLEATFILEPNVYKAYRSMDKQLWFRLRFQRDLFCLPHDWCQFWLQVDLSEPSNLLF